jgi:ABC-type transporter Mla subunit MlaD
MKRDRNALKSGVFIILTVVLIIAVIVGIKGAENLSEPKESRAVSFDLKSDVGGLQIGDDVRVGGFKVGTVQNITVVGAEDESGKEPPRVRVVFSFPKRYVLRRDALLRIQSTVTGQSCLNFESLGTGTKLPANEELAGRAGTLSEVLATVSNLSGPVTHILDTVDHTTLPAVNTTVTKFGNTADSFKATGDHATQLVDDARAQVPTAMDKYKAVMETANSALSAIRGFFGDTTSDFRSTLAHFASISSTIDKKMPSIVDNVDGVLKKVNTTVTSANAALEDIKTVAANTRDITGSAKSVIVGNRGKIDSMITSLKATGKNLEAATVEIRRSPWRLLYKPAPNEMANLNLYDAARQFAEGATELNDASLALRDAMRNGNTDRETVEKLMNKLNGSFDNFQKVENQLWTKVKE